MKIIAMMMLILSSCATQPKRFASKEPVPIVVKQIPHTGIGFVCKTCREDEKEKVRLAQIKANEVVKSACFENFMAKWGLIWTNNKSAKQVVEHIRNSNVSVPVHYYMGDCGVVGYRQPPHPDIYFNRCTHNSYKADKRGICYTASNAAHEWSHVLGYDHPFNRTWNRGKTVPYAINQAFNECCI